MGFARAASRAFSRITPKAWRGKKKTENFDLPRDHSDSKQSYVNLVGSHRDAKGKVRKYDLISDQDTGDLYVANYSSGKTKYIHSGNVVKDHTAVDFGTFDNKQRARVQGQYSGLDATVKYLRDNGIHVEGLDRTRGHSTSPRFTGSLIDPRSRHTIGNGYANNSYDHRNYVPLDPLSDAQKSWRATQNKPGNPPASGPAPSKPKGPNKPSGPRFNQPSGNPFSGSGTPPKPPKSPQSGPSGTGTTFGPAPSQNQAGKGWRATIRVPQTTETGSAVKTPRDKPQDIVSEMKALGFTPQTQSKGKTGVKWGKRKEAWPENLVEMSPDEYLAITGNKSPKKPEALESLSEAMAGGKTINPVSIRYDADGKMIEQEGNHRAMAAKAAGEVKIPVYTSTWKNNGGSYEPVTSKETVASAQKPAKRVSKSSKPVVEGLPPEEAATVAEKPVKPFEIDKNDAELSQKIAALLGRGKVGPIPSPETVKAAQGVKIPEFDSLDDLPADQQREISTLISAKAFGNKNTTLASSGAKPKRLSRENDITEYSKKPVDDEGVAFGDVRLKGSEAIADSLFAEMGDAPPEVQAIMGGMANRLTVQADSLARQKKLQDEVDRLTAEGTESSLEDARRIKQRVKEEVADVNVLTDPQGIADASMVFDPQSGGYVHPVYEEMVPTGISSQTLDDFDRASHQFNVKPDMTEEQKQEARSNIRGSGGSIKEFPVMSLIENPSAPINSQLDQIPNYQDKVRQPEGEKGEFTAEQSLEEYLSGQERFKVPKPKEPKVRQRYVEDIASRVAAAIGQVESEKTIGLAGRSSGSSRDSKQFNVNSKTANSQLHAAEKSIGSAEATTYAEIAAMLHQDSLSARDLIKKTPKADRENVYSQHVDDGLMKALETYQDRIPPSLLGKARDVGAVAAVDEFLAGKDKSYENVATAIDTRDKIDALNDNAIFNSIREALPDDSPDVPGVENAGFNAQRNVDLMLSGIAPREEVAHVQPNEATPVIQRPDFIDDVTDENSKVYFAEGKDRSSPSADPYSEVGNMDVGLSQGQANGDLKGKWIVHNGDYIEVIDHNDPDKYTTISKSKEPRTYAAILKQISEGAFAPF